MDFYIATWSIKWLGICTWSLENSFSTKKVMTDFLTGVTVYLAPLDSLPPCPSSLTQLNVWSKHLRLTEIKFISFSTKYSCSRWCNKICGLSILSVFAWGNFQNYSVQQMDFYIATWSIKWLGICTWSLENSFSTKKVTVYDWFSYRCPSLSYPPPWLSSPPGGKLSRPVYLAPHPYRGNNLIWCFQFICSIPWYLHVFLKL